MNTLIFSDGACSGNPGPGGWGAIIASPDGKVKELGGAERDTTNNRMELSGAIAALRYASKIPGPIDFYTDSTYVIRGITQWIWGWKKRGWKNAEGQPVLNRDLWEFLADLVSTRNGAKGEKSTSKRNAVNWLYSRGHIGTPGNERCDEIAVAYSKNKWVELYEGPLIGYGVAIYDVPEDSSLPEIRPKVEKVKAHSYLSMVGGQVYRHRDWASCERRVKGVPGAKFKKAMSVADESTILSGWNVSPTATIKGED